MLTAAQPEHKIHILNAPHAPRGDYSEYIDSQFGLNIPQHKQLSSVELAAICALGDTMASASRFIRGDAARIAQDSYGDNWYQYLAYDSARPSTLENYARICRKFTLEFRRAHPMKFRYYERVAGLELADAARWLDYAKHEQIDPDTMRDMINAELDAPKPRKGEIEAEVGHIDTTLIEDYGIPKGTIVKISFEYPKVEGVEDEDEQE